MYVLLYTHISMTKIARIYIKSIRADMYGPREKDLRLGITWENKVKQGKLVVAGDDRVGRERRP